MLVQPLCRLFYYGGTKRSSTLAFTLENAHRIVSWVHGDDVVAVHRHLPIALPPEFSNWNDERRLCVNVLGR
jgi:hypothetical protein